ncbi:MAG: nucleoside kinase [Spirochaetaceae bacterium]|nr:nucleoside kinase [Spirochaetaceae bacterium]
MSTNLTIRWLDGETEDAAATVSGEFPVGTTSDEALDALGICGTARKDIAAVYANNEIQSLSAPLVVNTALKPVSLASHEGRVVYRASLAFLLGAAAAQVFPNCRLIVGHSLGNGYYYHFADEKPASTDEFTRLKQKIIELVEADFAISFYYVAHEEAVALFQEQGQTDTVTLLEERIAAQVPVYECNGWVDLTVGALVPRTGILSVFDIFPYEDGFLLRYPTSSSGGIIGPFEDIPKLFAVYREYKQWGRIVGLHSAGDLNRLTGSGNIEDFIRIAEAFHAKKLADAADKIYAMRGDVHIVLIAGPSSSGKTTSAKRIFVQLRVLGMEPLAISLDDYYNPPNLAPKDENGNPDLECLEALDVPYLNEQLERLLSGDEITLPVFDFKTCIRREGRKVRAGRRTIIVIEGIHGLNDKLTEMIPAKAKFKLYVSPLTQLNLDDHNRVPTSDNRLIRRLVRDHQFRGTGASRTLSMWPSVRRGELRHIFPYQNSADFIFNSALDYELAVLKFYAEPLLHTVKPRETAFAEASRLLGFLDRFTPILPQTVPPESILREFIGGSGFKY